MPVSRTKQGIGVSAVAVILAAIFTLEGGYVNDPKDPGGETNHGITVSVARDAGYLGSMRDLDQATATDIYITNYIDRPGYGNIIPLSAAVGHKIVDAGVNTGTGRSSRWFQIALNSLNRGGRDYAKIPVDGAIGPSSVNAYTNLQRVRGKVKACEMVIKLMDAQQATHYMSLTNLSGYTPGWVDHRVGNVPLSKCKE